MGGTTWKYRDPPLKLLLGAVLHSVQAGWGGLRAILWGAKCLVLK